MNLAASASFSIAGHGALEQDIAVGENAVLVARGLTKVIGKRTVVNNVSVGLAAGELMGLLGPNGAGKSTTFKMIAGLLKPTAGHVHFAGEEWHGESLAHRVHCGLGYLPQDPSVFRRMTVADNMRAALECRGVKGAALEEELQSLSERFHLVHLFPQTADTLSGGERRRLEIARACAMRPKILMLDEPFAGIDPVSIDELITHIKRLKSEGIGVLITDHNVYEALPLCDRAVVLHLGQVLAHGTPQELMQHPLVKKYYLGSRFGHSA